MLSALPAIRPARSCASRAGLEQHAVELAPREGLEDQPGEEGEVADDEQPEDGEDDPVAPGGRAFWAAETPQQSIAPARSSSS